MIPNYIPLYTYITSNARIYNSSQNLTPTTPTIRDTEYTPEHISPRILEHDDGFKTRLKCISTANKRSKHDSLVFTLLIKQRNLTIFLFPEYVLYHVY